MYLMQKRTCVIAWYHTWRGSTGRGNPGAHTVQPITNVRSAIEVHRVYDGPRPGQRNRQQAVTL